MSGKFSQVAAHLCLGGACIVGALGIFRVAVHQPRLSFGGVLMLVGFCLVMSHWIKPPLPPLPKAPNPPETGNPPNTGTNTADKESRVPPVRPGPTAKEIADELAKKLPAIPKQEAGNLKQRALKLSEDIEREMNERWKNHWANKTTREEIHAGYESQSGYFRWKFLADVKSMHAEFAELHLRSQDLDDFLRYEEIDENARRTPSQPGFPPHKDRVISPFEVTSVVEGLRVLAGQLKD